jgi:hypothetical protein
MILNGVRYWRKWKWWEWLVAAILIPPWSLILAGVVALLTRLY